MIRNRHSSDRESALRRHIATYKLPNRRSAHGHTLTTKTLPPTRHPISTPTISSSGGTDFTDVVAPKPSDQRITNRELLAGPEVEPAERISLYSSTAFEQLVEEWAYVSLTPKYARVQSAPGAGDKGRDVLGFVSEDTKTSEYDLFQCKHYSDPLIPTDIWLELGKLCYNTYLAEFPKPRKYYLVGSKGIGPTLQLILNNPEKIRQGLLSAWDKKCKTKLKVGSAILMEGEFLNYVQRFDFSIVDSIEIKTIINALRGSPYYSRRFGGLVPKRPSPSIPPDQIAESETNYVRHLLQAYSDYKGVLIETPASLKNTPELSNHLSRQREAFYRAESLREFERDTLADDSAFEALKEEIYLGVIDVCDGEHKSGYHRVREVTKEARRLNPTDYVLANQLHIEDRTGICHHLSNEKRLLWVK